MTALTLPSRVAIPSDSMGTSRGVTSTTSTGGGGGGGASVLADLPSQPASTIMAKAQSSAAEDETRGVGTSSAPGARGGGGRGSPYEVGICPHTGNIPSRRGGQAAGA